MTSVEMLNPSSVVQYIPGGFRPGNATKRKFDGCSNTKWVLDDDKDSSGERELYFGDCTVEWSKVSSGGARALVRSLTMSSKIRDAFFARFRVAPDGLCVTDEGDSEATESLQCGVGVLDENGVFSFFDEAGNDYRVRIEFAVERIVPLRIGVLIERKWSPGVTSACMNDNSVPASLYYLQHPLDLINPVVAVVNESDGGATYRTTTFREQRFVAFMRCSGARRTGDNESWFEEAPTCDLLMTFNETQQRCSIWQVRVPTREEQSVIVRNGVTTHAEDEPGSQFAPASAAAITLTPHSIARAASPSSSFKFAMPICTTSGAVRSRNARSDRHSIAASTRFGTPLLPDGSATSLLPPALAETATTPTESHNRVLERMAEALRLDGDELSCTSRRQSTTPFPNERTARSGNQSSTATRRRTVAGVISGSCTPVWGPGRSASATPKCIPASGNTPLSKFDLINFNSTNPSCMLSVAGTHSYVNSTLLKVTSSSLASLSPESTGLHEHFLPELLLERVFVDDPVATRVSHPVVTAFSTTDLLGEHLLCYLLASEPYLRVARIELAPPSRPDGPTAHDEPSRAAVSVRIARRERIVIGDGHAPPRAACPLRRARMWVALDAAGTLFLYSGTAPIGKLAVSHHFDASVFRTPRRNNALRNDAAHLRTRSPHNRSFTEQPSLRDRLHDPLPEPASTNLPAAIDDPNPSASIAPHRCAFSNIAMPSCTAPDSSFVASTCPSAQTAPATAPDAPTHPPATEDPRRPPLAPPSDPLRSAGSASSSLVSTLCDPTDSRFSLQLVDGSLYRIGIAPLCHSTVVERCLASLAQLIPASDWHTLAKAWYLDTRALFRRPPAAALHTDADAAELRTLVHFLLTSQFGFRFVHLGDRHVADSTRSQHATQSALSSTALSSQRSGATQQSNATRSGSDRLSRIAEEIAPSSGSKRPRCESSSDPLADATADADWLFFAAHTDVDADSEPDTVFFDSLRRFIAPYGAAEPQRNAFMYVLDAAASRLPNWKWAGEALTALHLVYEETKLGSLRTQLAELGLALLALARGLRLAAHIEYYSRDLLTVAPGHLDAVAVAADTQTSTHTVGDPASIFDYVNDLIARRNKAPHGFPILAGVNTESAKLITVMQLYIAAHDAAGCTESNFCSAFDCIAASVAQRELAQRSVIAQWRTLADARTDADALGFGPDERFVHCLVALGIGETHVSKWPAAVRLLVLDQVRRAMQRSAASDSRSFIDAFLGVRSDARDQYGFESRAKRTPKSARRGTTERNGMEHVAADETVACLFKDDLRVDEVVTMLDSSCVQKVRLRAGVRTAGSDAASEEDAETALARLALRTVALPIGRGAFTLRTLDELDEATPLAFPELVLRGTLGDSRAAATATSASVELRPEDVPALTWPSFQNGVASALRIGERTRVEPSWILLTRAAAQQRAANADSSSAHSTNAHAADEFAGCLLGLALNGRLKLDTFNVFECLTRAHEPTSIALLLGLACQRRGSGDRDVLRLLAIHVRSCLPLAVAAESGASAPGETDARAHAHADLGVSACLQSAALLAFGFLFDRRPSGHVAQALLAEIGRAPANDGDSEQNANREAHALSAGVALGMCMFAQGAPGAAEHRFVETALLGRLFAYLTGTRPAELPDPPSDSTTRCTYNAHVTGPAAALALALIYFDTADGRVSGWLRTPTTQYALDAFLPETLLVRTIAHSLVNWRHVEPTAEWLRSNVPAPLLRANDEHNCANGTNAGALLEIDAETAELTELAVRTGACLSLAIRFAGTFSKAALRTVSNQFLDFLKRFAAPKPTTRAEASDRCFDVLREAPHFVETCLCALLLALATIMAGSCDVDLLRFLRYFRARPAGATHSDTLAQTATVGYGSHVATALSTGLLFLGSGRLSLNNSLDALVPLLLTVYPRFPTSPADNRYHLQAARNLYALAAERRALTVRKLTWRSLVTGRCRPTALIRLRQADAQAHGDRPAVVVTKPIPCLLPPLDTIHSLTITVRFADSRPLSGRSWTNAKTRAVAPASDWLIEFSRDRNWHILTEILRNGGVLSVSADDQFCSFAKRCAVAVDRFMRAPCCDDTLKFRELRLLHTLLVNEPVTGKVEDDANRQANDSLFAYSNKVTVERRIDMCFDKKKDELCDAFVTYVETGTLKSATFACFLIWVTSACGSQSADLLKLALESARRGQSLLDFVAGIRERYCVTAKNLPAVINLFDIAARAASKSPVQ